jgi:hypothetical protein
VNIGNEEWIQKVNEHYSFPCKIAFVLIKEKDGTTCIFSTEIKSSAKLDNVKYSSISKDTWTSEASAILSIKNLHNASEYLAETKKLNDIWDFALIKTAGK